MLFARSTTRTNPVFYPERLDHRLEHDPARRERIRTDHDSVDLLVWNIFASLDSDRDRPFLAGQLQPLGGSGLRAPLSLSLWTGVHREPLLRPSPAYQRWLTRTAGGDDDLSDFTAPIEVPVRIESPDVLVFVDVSLNHVPRGVRGRDRIVELIDAGAEQARAVGKDLVVSYLYRSGSRAAAQISRRLDELRRERGLARALPWRDTPPPVQLRELPWQRMVRIWQRSRDGLQLSRQPVKRFVEHCSELGLD